MMKSLGALSLIVTLVCCIQIADAQPIDEEVIKVVDPDVSFALTKLQMKKLRDAGFVEDFDYEKDTDDAGNEKIKNSVRYSRVFECDKETEIIQELESILPKEAAKSGVLKHLQNDEQSLVPTARGRPVAKPCQINLEFDLKSCEEEGSCPKRFLFNWIGGIVASVVHGVGHLVHAIGHFVGK